jgi:hypothetical protein
MRETTESCRHYTTSNTPETAEHNTTSNTPYHSGSQDGLTPRACLWTRLPQLNNIDHEYLVNKGVFDKPAQYYL